MKKTLLFTTLAMGLTLPALAAEYSNTGDSRYEAPSFTEESKEIVEESPREQESKQVLPIILNADHAEYDQTTGNFEATGNVTIQQGTEKLLTTHAHGNMHTGDIWLEQGGNILNNKDNIKVGWAYYNMNKRTGEIKAVSGNSGKNYLHAPHAIIEPDKITMDQGGENNRCPSIIHPACLSVKAKTFEIYPNEKMVAKDVKVYIRGKHVYSRDIWVNYLDSQGTRIVPRFSLSEDNGFGVRIAVDHNFDEKTRAEADLPFYSKAGYKPVYQLHHDERNFKLRYKYGWEEDDDEWYKKENDIRLDYKPHYFYDGIPVTYYGYYSYGLWKREDHADSKSWHKEYAAFLHHDPIYLFNSKNTALDLVTGKKWIHESESGETASTNLYYATLNQKLDKNWKTWVGYYKEDRTTDLYDIDQPDMDTELANGLEFKAGKNDTFTIVNRYDLDKNANYETNYRWRHKFCCWHLDLEYQDEHYDGGYSLKLRYYFYNL